MRGVYYLSSGNLMMNVTLPAPAVSVFKQMILVVEDEFLIREMLCELLREAGYNVIEADSGDEPMTILSHGTPDLIVTDVRMPGSLDGIQLVAKVRKTNAAMPIIITSSHLLSVIDATNSPTYFLPKPYEFDALVDLVQVKLR
jgi:DNA-binding NtrC family response regulator